jgi:hypothetical protein
LHSSFIPYTKEAYFNPGGGRIITMYPPLLTFQIVFGNGLQDLILKIWKHVVPFSEMGVQHE